MRLYILYFIMSFLLSGCRPPVRNDASGNGANAYARGFQMEKNGSVTRLTVFNPWEKADRISLDYFLLKKGRAVPDSIREKHVIRVPVSRVVCLSTTHLAFLDALAEQESVVGVSGKQYVFSPGLKSRIDNDEVADVGYGQNLNYELIVHLDPDVVFVYGVDSDVTGHIRKLEELGIPAVVISEYLEETPLGKTEWIKFLGAFFQKENMAADYFRKTETEYHRLKKLVSEKKASPEVLVGSPYRDAWWVPGGRSYLANLIADAGGNYPGRKNDSRESYVISFENALAWGGQADVWINMGNMASKQDIIASDQRFEHFKVLKEGRVYNNINRMGEHGGNDFWESGTVHPDVILRDLIHIFYPGLVDGEMIYYKAIK
jgi:iron complex transport system substrate-binding protein